MVIQIGCSSGYAEMAGFQMDSEGNAKVTNRIYEWMECHMMRWMRLNTILEESRMTLSFYA